MKAHPVSIACLALVGLVIAAVSALAGVGKAIPTILPELGIALLAAGAGVTAPGVAGSSTSSPPPPPPPAP